MNLTNCSNRIYLRLCMDYYATTLVGKLVKIGGPSRIVFGTKSSTIRHIDHKFGMNVSKNVTNQHVIITCIYSVPTVWCTGRRSTKLWFPSVRELYNRGIRNPISFARRPLLCGCKKSSPLSDARPPLYRFSLH